MSRDSVSPSSLSLRTSRLKLGVSRPSSAASSGARTVGWRSMIARVALVHGPTAESPQLAGARRRPTPPPAGAGTGGRRAAPPHRAVSLRLQHPAQLDDG